MRTIAMGCVALWIGVMTAFADGVSTPVFRGVLGMGGRATALFEVPGQSGNFEATVGSVIPGTKWKVVAVYLPTGQVSVDVGRKQPVLMAQGDTYLSGEKSVKAPEVARPENHPLSEYRPPSPEELARQARALAAQRAAATQALASAPPASAPLPATNEGLVETVDVSKEVPSIASFAKPGYTTAVMVTSAACPTCRVVHPQLELLPTRKPSTRVVFADIGTTAKGRINFNAPFFSAQHLREIPYIYLLDEAGTVHAEGNESFRVLQQYLPDLK